VLVNGNRLHAGEPFPLKDGDQIFIDRSRSSSASR
jgi:hypothetical protein